jgi:hypothetical protein
MGNSILLIGASMAEGVNSIVRELKTTSPLVPTEKETRTIDTK